MTITLNAPAPAVYKISVRGERGPAGPPGDASSEISDISGLQTALDGKADAAATSSALAAKAASSHTHSQSDITGLATALDSKADAAATSSALAAKAASSHTHSQSDITGLATALDSKADAAATSSALAAKAGKVVDGQFNEPSPTVRVITLRSAAQVGRTINSLKSVKTSAGTVTFTIKIAGVAVTGLSGITATTTPQDLTASDLNVVSVGDSVILDITAVSGAANFGFTGVETLT